MLFKIYLKLFKKLIKDKINKLIMIYKIEYKYSLIQKKSLCGAACLQTILFRKGIWIDQETLAKKLKINILEKYKHAYSIKFPTVKKENSLLGIDLKNFSSKSFKTYLKKFNLNSEVHFYENETILNIIISALKSDQDIIVNLKLTTFYPESKTGHYVLIKSFDTRKNIISFQDPDFENKSTWKCSAKKFLESLSNKYDGETRGICIIKPLL